MTRRQNSKSSCDTQVETLVGTSFEKYLNSLGMIFVSVSFLMLITDIVSANTLAGNGQILPQTIRMDPNGWPGLELLRAEIGSSKDTEEEGKDKLRRMIEQVRSVQFKTEVEVVEAPVVPDEAAVLEPNETVFEAPPPKTEEVQKNEIEPPNKGISDQTLTMLKNSLQSPDKVNDPLELGEILFSSGNTKDAVLFYQEALKRTDPNDIRLSQDRAWMIFQIANCLRNHEPPAAAETYRKLYIEYPDSLWADVAKVQRELIGWRLKERPHELITEPEDTGNQRN